MIMVWVMLKLVKIINEDGDNDDDVDGNDDKDQLRW